MLRKIEAKLYKFSIPNLIRYIIIILMVGFFINVVDNQIYSTYLALDFNKIKSGEIWRIFSFLFYTDTSTGILDVLFFIFSLVFYNYIGNSLEMIWGKFWFNVYILFGIIFNILGSLIVYSFTGLNVSIGLNYVLQSMFLAYAFLFQETKINFYFIFPIKIKWLGIFYGALLILSTVAHFIEGSKTSISLGVLIIVSMLNLIILILLTKNRQTEINRTFNRLFDNFMKLQKQIIETETQESVNTKIKEKEKKYIHKCCICGRTELDNPELEFRYCSKCDGEYEYCSDHIFNHEHKKKD